MDNENKWEYDYSSQDKNESGDTGYPNVGSSGMNTANTARTDYSSQQAGQQSQAQGAQADGYTSTMHGGGSNGYNYTSAPSQPPTRKMCLTAPALTAG